MSALIWLAHMVAVLLVLRALHVLVRAARRDYFAAKALQALIGYAEKDGQNRGPKAVPILAGFAYEYADAMVKARKA